MSIIPSVGKVQSKAPVCVYPYLYMRFNCLQTCFSSLPISLYQTSSHKGRKVLSLKSQSAEGSEAKQHLPDTVGPSYLWTHNCDGLPKTCTRSTQSAFQHAVGNGLWAPTANWGAADRWPLLGKETQFSLSVVSRRLAYHRWMAPYPHVHRQY